jgi:hypothetical protein
MVNSSIECLKNFIHQSNLGINQLTHSISDVVDMNNYVININEQKLIQQLLDSFYASRKSIPLDLNFKTRLSKLKDVNLELMLSNRPMIKSMMANFMIQPIKRVIYFAQHLYDFTKLDLDDQLSLIREGSLEISICSASMLYDCMSNEFYNRIDTNYIENDDNNNQPFISLDQVSSLWGNEISEKTIKYLNSMNQLGLDETARILYLILILFSPDRRGLRNTNLITQLQNKYAFLFKKYLVSKHGEEKSKRLYNELMEKYNELSTLQDIHKVFLSDCDRSQLDNMLKAIVINETMNVI